MVIGEYMTDQCYLMVNKSTNIVENTCMWNGDTETWTPPSNVTMLIQSTTPAKIWELNTEKTDFVLTEKIGVGDKWFTWDGSVLTTHEEKPTLP